MYLSLGFIKSLSPKSSFVLGPQTTAWEKLRSIGATLTALECDILISFLQKQLSPSSWACDEKH